eukprot:106101-Pelagomonas_calceolata.AAC.1
MSKLVALPRRICFIAFLFKSTHLSKYSVTDCVKLGASSVMAPSKSLVQSTGSKHANNWT